MRALLLASLLLWACAPVAPPPRPPGTLSGAEGPAFDPEKTRRDLESSARTQHGDALVVEALAAPAFLIAKRYAGMLPPPPPDAGPDYRHPDPPTFVLVRRERQWLVARAGGGFAALPTDKAARLDAALAEPGFWKEPVWAPPGCTDAGASLIWLKLPGRPAQVRSGTCGETQRTERLVSILLDP